MASGRSLSRIQLMAIAGLLLLVAVVAGGWFKSRPVTSRLSTSLPPQRHQAGAFTVAWSGEQLVVTHREAPEHTLWATVPGEGFLAVARGEETVTEARGSFFIEDERRLICQAQSLTAMESQENGVVLSGEVACPGGQGTVPYTLRFDEALADQLAFTLSLANEQYNRIYLTYAADAEEHFFGFGTQFSTFDMKGRRLPIFVMEQGIGRGAQPLTTLVNLVADAGGAWHTTYAGVPHYISSELRSLFLENYEYVVFDMRQVDRVQIELFANTMRGRILYGESPAALIESYTAFAGRMRPLPEWILEGAVIGVQGGSETVRRIWQQLDEHETPVAAFWLQDWVGQRSTSFGERLWWNWELDRERYPEWEALVADLNAAGVEVLVYTNPFLVDAAAKGNSERNLFREATAGDYLVQEGSGEPYLLEQTDFSAGLVDLTNPEAVAWLREVLATEVIGSGARGWMADFGEGLPYDARLYSGEPGATYHNRYPEAWATVNREVVEAHPAGDELVFFTRSGFTRSPGASTLFWLGDQLVTWDADDGIKTAVTGLLSSGISGFSLNHSDIGGYTALTSPVKDYFRSKELLLRWMELNAFTTIYRSHEGNRPADNVQFYEDEETMAHFSRFARVYEAWEFYRQTLVEEAAETGMPVVRHLFLHYPDDPNVYEISYEEFMVGSDLLVAPVLDPQTETVDVYLPQGSWVHLWSGERYTAGSAGLEVTVDAPLGEPGVFYRQGSAVGARFVENLEALAE